VLTEQEEVFGVDEMVQEGTTQSNHEQAKLAAENSGLDFSSMLPKKVNHKNNIIEILEDKEHEALDEYIKEEVLVKLEKDDDKDTMRTNTLKKILDNNGSTNRRSGRQRISKQRYEDYELYVTAEEVEKERDRNNGEGDRPLGMSKSKEDGNNNDNEGLVAVAHYIMVHYVEKQAQKRRRKKYKPKSGQYQLEAGIKHFGDQEEIVVTKEIQQFNMYGVFEPKLADDLTDTDKKASLIFLKEKRNGDTKARSCANGTKQKEHIAKEEAAVPTVALESVFITTAIDAKEHQKVVTIAIPGAFLHANNED
jgi:hypothetical protein